MPFVRNYYNTLKSRIRLFLWKAETIGNPQQPDRFINLKHVAQIQKKRWIEIQ